MTKIVFTDRLEFGGEQLAVHLGSDRQIYVLLGDLCNFIGLDAEGMAERIQHDVSMSDLLVIMSGPVDALQGQGQPSGAFLNLAALPYWLGMVSLQSMEHPDHHDQLARYAFDFLDTSWMLYRAAVRDLERAGVGRTRIGGTRNRTRLPNARPRF